MTTPAVMTDGGIYLMYYFGGNFEETSISDYVKGDFPGMEAKIKGMKMRIGVAVSQDGETWGRVEGDDPSGACMVPYDKSDPEASATYSGMKDEYTGKAIAEILEEELYVGWPEVVVKIDEQKADNSGFFMYYSTMTKETKEKCLAVAISSDGFRWYKRGICLRPGSSEEGTTDDAFDGNGCARCSVVRNAIYSELEQTWTDSPGYMMLYEGVSSRDNKHHHVSRKY